MKKIRIIFSLVFLLLCFASKAFAVSIQVSNVPLSITTQDFTVSASVSGASSNTTNYLRAAFYTDASPTNYFGYTYNGTSWYNGTPPPIDPHQFLPISIDSQGSWSGQLKIKLDTDSTAFLGSGNYNIKVARYTASATSISDWSNSSTVIISAPTTVPTSTPTPTSKNSPTSPKSPTTTSAPTATKNSTGVQTSAVNLTLIPTSNREGGASDSADILGESTQSANPIFAIATNSPTPTFPMKLLASSSFNWPFFIGIFVLVVVCGILAFRYWKRRKKLP